MPRNNDHPRSIHCPRCDYQLESSIAASEARGEDNGRCSECGLELAWSSLREVQTDPIWFVESRIAPRHLLRRAVETLVMCVRPFAFWTRISMGIPLRMRGLLAFLLVVALVGHSIGVGGRVIRNTRYNWLKRTHPTANLLFAIVSPASNHFASTIIDTYARLGTTDNVGLAMAFVRAALLEGDLVLTSTNDGEPTSVVAFARAPWLVDPATTRRLLAGALVPMTAPLLLLLLPISLGRARVRRAHIVRACAYSTALVLPCFVLAIYATHAHWYMTVGTTNLLGRLEPHVITIFAAAIVVVWMSAISSRYLRMSHPIAVGCACTAIATLISLMASAAMFGAL